MIVNATTEVEVEIGPTEVEVENDMITVPAKTAWLVVLDVVVACSEDGAGELDETMTMLLMLVGTTVAITVGVVSGVKEAVIEVDVIVEAPRSRVVTTTFGQTADMPLPLKNAAMRFLSFCGS